MTWRMTWQWVPWVLFVSFCFVFCLVLLYICQTLRKKPATWKYPWSQKNSLPSRKRPWQNLLCLTRGSRKEQPGKTDNLWQLQLYSRQKQRSNFSPTPSSRGWTGSLDLLPSPGCNKGLNCSPSCGVRKKAGTLTPTGLTNVLLSPWCHWRLPPSPDSMSTFSPMELILCGSNEKSGLYHSEVMRSPYPVRSPHPMWELQQGLFPAGEMSAEACLGTDPPHPCTTVLRIRSAQGVSGDWVGTLNFQPHLAVKTWQLSLPLLSQCPRELFICVLSSSVVSDSLWHHGFRSPGSSVHGIFQARILEWVAISYSRGSSWPRDQTFISWIGRQILYHCPLGKPPS